MHLRFSGLDKIKKINFGVRKKERERKKEKQRDDTFTFWFTLSRAYHRPSAPATATSNFYFNFNHCKLWKKKKKKNIPIWFGWWKLQPFFTGSSWSNFLTWQSLFFSIDHRFVLQRSDLGRGYFNVKVKVFFVGVLVFLLHNSIIERKKRWDF